MLMVENFLSVICPSRQAEDLHQYSGMIRQHSDDVEVFISLKPSPLCSAQEKVRRRGLVLSRPGAIFHIQTLPRWCLSPSHLEELFLAQWFAPTAAKIESKDGAIEIDDHPRTWPVACWPRRRPPGLSSPLIGRLADDPVPAKGQVRFVGWL